MSRITPDSVIEKHFTHLRVNQMDHKRFLQNPQYKLGFEKGYADYLKPNPFGEGTLEWAAWFYGYKQKKADLDFWDKEDERWAD